MKISQMIPQLAIIYANKKEEAHNYKSFSLWLNEINVSILQNYMQLPPYETFRSGLEHWYQNVKNPIFVLFYFI